MACDWTQGNASGALQGGKAVSVWANCEATAERGGTTLTPFRSPAPCGKRSVVAAPRGPQGAATMRSKFPGGGLRSGGRDSVGRFVGCPRGRFFGFVRGAGSRGARWRGSRWVWSGREGASGEKALGLSSWSGGHSAGSRKGKRTRWGREEELTSVKGSCIRRECMRSA